MSLARYVHFLPLEIRTERAEGYKQMNFETKLVLIKKYPSRQNH